MFKKFSVKEDISVINTMKSSVYRGIRNTLVEQHAALADVIDEVLPKKAEAMLAKGTKHNQFLVVDNEIRFYCERDGVWMPTLKLVHRYPNILPHVQVDKGAIKFVLSGAQIMCRGLTSPGSKMDVELEANTPCIVMAEGKEHALAIGLLKLSTQQIRDENKGIGIDNVHYLNDSLWNNTRIADESAT